MEFIYLLLTHSLDRIALESRCARLPRKKAGATALNPAAGATALISSSC